MRRQASLEWWNRMLVSMSNNLAAPMAADERHGAEERLELDESEDGAQEVGGQRGDCNGGNGGRGGIERVRRCWRR